MPLLILYTWVPPLKNILKKSRSCPIVINIYAFPPKVFFLLLQLIRHNGSYELLSSLCVRKLLWLYLLLWNHYTLQPSLVGMFIGRISAKFMYSVPIENSTWLQGPLIFLEMLSFSDIVGMFIRSEMKDHKQKYSFPCQSVWPWQYLLSCLLNISPLTHQTLTGYGNKMCIIHFLILVHLVLITLFTHNASLWTDYKILHLCERDL